MTPQQQQHPTPAVAMATIAMPAQSSSVQPEDFQSRLIDSISAALLRQPSPPCLLRAPTGAGKTLVMGQVLERVSAQRDVLWFWFVPFVTLVQQTEDALRANASSLAPCGLQAGRNQEAHPGMVLLSTAQAVARAQWRTKGYDADGDDETRTLAAFVARARAQGLQIGLVVDEAHIALDKGTEFGKFAHWLCADYLLMATATPKDDRLNDFLRHAGYSAQEVFAVSRDEVVQARLNKQYIEAVIYSLGQTLAQVADLHRTVLRQSWRRNRKIEQALQAAGIPLVPLLLVQVGNGDEAVDEAAHDLMHLCGVPPDAIGRHTANDPDPVMMAAIANDTSKRVLVFKQSAGTGFDAPRAFVLASTKHVNDPDFAMQFIGRVMRVARPVRDAFARQAQIAPELNTAYVYLANAQAQAGFEAAVQATSAVQSALQGQTEKLLARQTVSGAVVYTNRPTEQSPIAFDLPLPEAPPASTVVPTPAAASAPAVQAPLFQYGSGTATLAISLQEAETNYPLDEVQRQPAPRKSAPRLKTRAEVLAELQEHGLRVYPRKPGLPQLPPRLKTEQKPELDDMSEISRAVATRLALDAGNLRAMAVKAALNRIKDIERHTELTTQTSYSEEIHIVTDRNALAREALAALRALPQAEEEDYRIIVQVLSSRLRPDIDDALDDLPENAQPNEAERTRLARDAAHWVILKQAQTLCEDMFSEVARRAKLIEAQPLPDVMVFPAGIALEPSDKNIYGVLPPSPADGQRVAQELIMDDRLWLADKTHTVVEGTLVQGQFDVTWYGNQLENAFSRALDRANFVLWWHRNPRNKPYAVRVVRAEHDNYFYPDFVVCVRHHQDDRPILRLLETKESTKDAANKAQHSPPYYGKVLFLTPDGSRMRWVNDDGSMGQAIDLDDMQGVLAQLAATRPVGITSEHMTA